MSLIWRDQTQAIKSAMDRFGEKLRTLRRREGITQTQLGEMLGVQQGYIGKLERGERVPSVALLMKLTGIFKVSFDQLMDDSIDLD